MFALRLCAHQRVVAQQRQPVGAVLLLDRRRHRVAALLLVDGVPFGLGQAEEAADHAQVLPQGAVLGAGVLLPAQQLAQPALPGRRLHLVDGTKTRGDSETLHFLPLQLSGLSLNWIYATCRLKLPPF